MQPKISQTNWKQLLKSDDYVCHSVHYNRQMETVAKSRRITEGSDANLWGYGSLFA